VRLVFVVWLLLCIPALIIAQGVWGLFWQGTPGPSFLDAGGISVLGLFPLAVIAALVDRRRPLKWPANRAGAVFWRVAAASLIEVAASELNMVADQQRDWAHIHRAGGAVSLLLQLAVAGFLLSAWLQCRKRAERA
jgi:hypothetical protein